MKSCPKCNLTNPATAQRCDCGYDFLSHNVEGSFLEHDSPENKHRIGTRKNRPRSKYIARRLLRNLVFVGLGFAIFMSLYPSILGAAFSMLPKKWDNNPTVDKILEVGAVGGALGFLYGGIVAAFHRARRTDS